MGKNSAQFILDTWTKHLHEKTEENKLELLYVIGEEIIHFLSGCTITHAYPDTDEYYDSSVFCIQMDDMKHRLTYFLLKYKGSEGHLYSSPVTSGISNNKISKSLLPLLDSLHLGRMERQLDGWLMNQKAFQAFLDYFQYPIVDIHYIQSNENGTFEAAVYDESYILVPREQRHELAKEMLIHEYSLLDVNQNPGDDSPVYWIEELTGVPALEILGNYSNTAEEGEPPHISEEDAYDFLENGFGEERYIQKELQERGYAGVFGKSQFGEISLEAFYMYRKR